MCSNSEISSVRLTEFKLNAQTFITSDLAIIFRLFSSCFRAIAQLCPMILFLGVALEATRKVSMEIFSGRKVAGFYYYICSNAVSLI